MLQPKTIAKGRMNATTRASSAAMTPDWEAALFRGTLKDVFANLERAPGVQVLVRHPLRGLLGARRVVLPEEGEGFLDYTQIGDDVYVVVANFDCKKPRIQRVQGDGMVWFYFKLSGDVTIAVSQDEPLHLKGPSLLVYFHPPAVDLRECMAPSVRERSVVVEVRAEYLAGHFGASLADSPSQLGAVAPAAPGQIQYCRMPLDSRMFELASKLIDNPYKGELALIHTEAITLELLCAAVAEFGSASLVPIKQYSEHDLHCLYAARAFLAGQLATAPTVRHVARAVGMSETSLKRGFKDIFGETMFSFSVHRRMEHALKLLREQHMPAAYVAEAVGYSHQSSFATAFRRQFGMCPKDARGLKSG